jgi:hypothetical protein
MLTRVDYFWPICPDPDGSAMTSKPLSAPCATVLFNGLVEAPHVQKLLILFCCTSSPCSMSLCIISQTLRCLCRLRVHTPQQTCYLDSGRPHIASSNSPSANALEVV